MPLHVTLCVTRLFTRAFISGASRLVSSNWECGQSCCDGSCVGLRQTERSRIAGIWLPLAQDNSGTWFPLHLVLSNTLATLSYLETRARPWCSAVNAQLVFLALWAEEHGIQELSEFPGGVMWVPGETGTKYCVWWAQNGLQRAKIVQVHNSLPHLGDWN